MIQLVAVGNCADVLEGPVVGCRDHLVQLSVSQGWSSVQVVMSTRGGVPAYIPSRVSF